MTNRTDLIIILAVLGIALFILWKSWIFKVVNTASDLASSAGELGNTVVTGANELADTVIGGVNQAVNSISTGANYVIGNVTDLPQNLYTLGTMLPDFFQALGWQMGINTYGIAYPTDRAKNIVESLRRMYPNLPSDRERVLASIADGITYDVNGFPVDRYGNPV